MNIHTFLKLKYSYFNPDIEIEQSNTKFANDLVSITDKMANTQDAHETQSLKGRVYPIASTGFANLFFAKTPKEQQKLVANLEAIFTRILPKIRLVVSIRDNHVEFGGFFSKLEELIQKDDPEAKVYLGGGSIRSIISFVYKELLDATKQGLDPLEVLESLANGSRKFSIETETGEISPMFVLGIESDIDIYIDFSQNCNCKEKIISKAKKFINKDLKELQGHPLKNLLFPPADVKCYKEQIQRAERNGGSALDWVAFPLSSRSGSHFKTPQKSPFIFQSICQGKLPYFPVDQAEIPTITTLRTYRSLFELPFLELDEQECCHFAEDLQHVIPSLKNDNVKFLTDQVFQKIVRNTRFPDRVNFELHQKNPVLQPRQCLLEDISNSIQSRKRLPALPEFLPAKVNEENLDLDLIQKFSELNLFMPIQTFVEKFTDNGILYHGTDLKNWASMIRGNLIVSNQKQGNAMFGRGFYATPLADYANLYSMGKQIISFTIQGENIKIVNFSSIPQDLINILTKKAKEKQIDVNEYLALYLQVDIIINHYVLLQNSRVFNLNKTQQQFLCDAFSESFNRLLAHFNPPFPEGYPNFLFDYHLSILDEFPILLGLADDQQSKKLQIDYELALSKALNFIKNSPLTTIWMQRAYTHSCVMNDKDTVLWFINNNNWPLKTILSLTINNNWPLKFASDRLKDDKEIVLAAINKDIQALQFASDRLKDDKDFILAAINKDVKALQFASDRLKNDKDFILAAINTDGRALQFANNQLKNDKDFILAAINKDGRALRFANKQLKNDKNITLTVANQNGFSTLLYANDRFKDDLEVSLAIIKSSINNKKSQLIKIK